MGDFEVLLSGETESPVKYHPFWLYVLTRLAKTSGNIVWWVVLVGRYPPKE